MDQAERAFVPVRDQPLQNGPEDSTTQARVEKSIGESPLGDPDEVEQPDTQRSSDSSSRSDSTKRQSLIGEFEVIKTIGVGAYSKVKKVRHQGTGLTFAIKVLNNKVPELAIEPANEIIAMQIVHSHPNIVTLHKVMASNSKLFLVLDYASKGDLFEFIVRNKMKHLREDESRHYFSQLIDAVDFMHQNGVCHRDIKAENCLVADNSKLLLSDFGFAKAFQPGEQPLSSRRCGTANYIAPEMLELRGSGPFDPFKSDIWACGVLLFFMLCGHLPFDSARPTNIYLRIQACKPTFPDYVSLEARDLVMGILSPTPSTRAPISAIKQHPWMTCQQADQGG